MSICSFTVFPGMGARGFTGFCQAKSPAGPVPFVKCCVELILSYTRGRQMGSCSDLTHRYPSLAGLLQGCQSPETMPLPQGQPRGDGAVGASVSAHALSSQACQPLCFDFTSARPSSGKGVRDVGHDCRAGGRHEGFPTKGYRGSRVPKSSSAHLIRKRK